MYSITPLVLALLTLLPFNPTINTYEEEAACACSAGIGSTTGQQPAMTTILSNGMSLATCGYFDEERQDGNGLIMSEFNVFDCQTGKSLVEYGAVQTCRVLELQDELIIQELKYMPTGSDWKWEMRQIGEQRISVNGASFSVSKQEAKYKAPSISKAGQKQFLKSITKRKGFGDHWEEEVSKLEVLALGGNKKAWKTLKKYEKIKGGKVDGALAEHWKDALANVRWIKGLD